MTTRSPNVGKLVLPGVGSTRLSEIVTDISVEYSIGEVAELTITLADVGSSLPAKEFLGARVRFDSEQWRVGAVDCDNTEAGSILTVRARDPLAQGLRKSYKTSVQKNLAPQAFIGSRVAPFGGKAVVQSGAKRSTIDQDKDSTVLDAIDSVCSDLGWVWCSYGGTMFAGARYAFWRNKIPGVRQWRVTWKTNPRTDALAMTCFYSDDNTDSAGELELELPYEYGSQLRPLDTVRVNADNAEGVWLVESVSITHDDVSNVSVRCTIPLRTRAKAGSKGS